MTTQTPKAAKPWGSLLRESLKSTNKWKLLAIIFAILNAKSLPLAWTIRLLRGLFIHIRTSRRLTKSTLPSPKHPQGNPNPHALFAPIITSSYASPLDCDYNFHKSNSTYFNDSDVGRLHLMVALFSKAIENVKTELRQERKLPPPGPATGEGGAAILRDRPTGTNIAVALGGVSAFFRREIKPFQRFEVWTRVLAWDGKWLYLVQHFVEVGKVKRGKALLQDQKSNGRLSWTRKRGGRQQEHSTGQNGAGQEDEDELRRGTHPAIFATVIAKYVFKQGRKSHPPERFIKAAGLLPLRPQENVNVPETNTNGHVSNPDEPTQHSNEDRTEVKVSNQWDWEKVEQERLRGMRMAELYAKLDGLNEEFSGDGSVILGQY